MIHSLRHLALTVPDLTEGAEFYQAFGLNMADRGGALGFRCDGRDHDEVILVETGRDRRFHYASFGADEASLPIIAQRLQDRGIARLDPPSADAPDGLWFNDADGNLVNVTVAAKASHAAEPVPRVNRPGVIERSGERGCPSRDIAARPRRMGHIILFTPDVTRLQRFYCDVLGMRLSDTIVDEYAAFMRLPVDSDHHVLGLLKSPGPGFHHVSFEMASIDEAALGAQRLFGKGFRHAWGPGRHGVGSNYFHYFRDPWNGLAEYYSDMDYVSAGCDWPVTEWTKKDGMFLWSADGVPPPDFGRNYELS
ncbi:VOC family protein [Sphingobium sp. SCG-1]|uniref:VOC family protein n=1 Tax=Sphingobium sp. SCG-1 TaxID=2072936 RepID=UPI00166FC859|nr:VOC family protein [Sphingobium sp. SCG-1]